MKKLALVAAVVLLGGCCWLGIRNCKKKAAGPRPCGLTAQVDLSPAADSRALALLDDQKQQGTADGLQGEFLAAHCQSLWSDLIEGVHCADRVKGFCEASCTTDTDRLDCGPDGNGHQKAVLQCLTQSQPAFEEHYPACRGFVVCQGNLKPPGTVCPTP